MKVAGHPYKDWNGAKNDGTNESVEVLMQRLKWTKHWFLNKSDSILDATYVVGQVLKQRKKVDPVLI